MFEIYKFEYDCQFITSEELHSYIGMGILSESDFHRIVVDQDDQAAKATEVQA